MNTELKAFTLCAAMLCGTNSFAAETDAPYTMGNVYSASAGAPWRYIGGMLLNKHTGQLWKCQATFLINKGNIQVMGGRANCFPQVNLGLSGASLEIPKNLNGGDVKGWFIDFFVYDTATGEIRFCAGTATNTTACVEPFFRP